MDQRIATIVADSLRYGEQPLKLYRLRAWVVMINHVHILIYSEVPLRRITQALKSYSARKANAILNRTGQPFWQHESYDHWVRSPGELEKIVRYIERDSVHRQTISAPPLTFRSGVGIDESSLMT